MSAPCPKLGFIIRSAPAHGARVLAQALTARLATTGLEVEAREGAAAIVITREGSQATESDRQFVIGLLNDELHVDGATISDLVDLNY